MARAEATSVDIRRLKYFVAVCEHGGLSRAASVIGIAQPALTRQIKLLESEVGTELFTRNGRGARPNEAGAFLLGAARRHLDALEDAVTRLRSDFAGQPAKISLGICPTIVPLFLDPVASALRASPLAPELSVIEAYSGDLQSLLSAGEIDLALTYAEPDHPAGDMQPLFTERLVLVSREPAITTPVTMAALADLKLILPSRIHRLRRIIDAVAARRNVTLSPALELDSLSTVKALVAEGAGQFATILPRHSVARDAAEGAFDLLPIDDPDMVRTIALVTPRQPRQPLPDLLTDLVLARAAELRASLEAVA